MRVRPSRKPKPAAARRPWGADGLVLFLLLVALVGLAAAVLLRSGRWLVREDAFGKGAWGMVLAGQSRNNERTDAAVRLHLEGRLDSVIVSGCRIFKNRYESEFVVDDMAGQGYDRGRIFEFRQDAYSTLEEARLLILQARTLGLDTVILITANFHTARAHATFERLAQGHPVFLAYPADYAAFDPKAWWSGRESKKIWLQEWMKRLFSFFELARARPVEGEAPEVEILPNPRPQGAAPGEASDSTVSPAPDSAAGATGAEGGSPAGGGTAGGEGEGAGEIPLDSIFKGAAPGPGAPEPAPRARG